jgi:hypothetical protein
MTSARATLIVDQFIDDMPMALDPFIRTSTGNNIDTPSLIDRIAAFEWRPESGLEPLTDDRWLLASNLQKAIRRGLVSTALGTATKLLAINPQYFWRRLMVIAYEDIGYGNIAACHELLKTFRREALQRDLGPERVGHYFVHALACATKNRSLCDALAMLVFSIRKDDYERQYKTLALDQLLEAACNAALPVQDRVAAMRCICGYGKFENGRFRTVIKTKPDVMRAVCERSQLSDMERALFLSGQNAAESLNVPIPIISEMTGASALTEACAPQQFHGVGGVLFAAMDRHTRVGNRCLVKFAQEAPALKHYIDSRPTLAVATVLGVAVFIAEGAALDRWLVFEGHEHLRNDFNESFLEYAGVFGSDKDVLLELVTNDLPKLNDIRAREFRQ